MRPSGSKQPVYPGAVHTRRLAKQRAQTAAFPAQRVGVVYRAHIVGIDY
jgi:hypothetical protein